MLKLLLSLSIVCTFMMIGNSQILIEGRTDNIIYSNISNRIEYTGTANCEDLIAKIEGYDEAIALSNCSLRRRYLKNDTSTFQILNTAGNIIFDTILLKNPNQPKAFVRIGGKSLSRGRIKKGDLRLIEGISVRYDCPWLDEAKIISYAIIITSEDGSSVYSNVIGHKVPRAFFEEMSQLYKPSRLYIENIQWAAIQCQSNIGSIELEID